MLAVAGVFIIARSFTGIGRVWRVIVAIIGFATPVLAYYGSLHPFPTFPNNRGLIFAGIAALIVVALVRLPVVRPSRADQGGRAQRRPARRGPAAGRGPQLPPDGGAPALLSGRGPDSSTGAGTMPRQVNVDGGRGTR